MSDKGRIEHNLYISDVINTATFEKKGGNELRGSNPIHGSSTGNNTAVNTQENIAHCFRCNSGGGPLLWIAAQEGIISCEEMGRGALRGDKAVEAMKIANDKYDAGIELEDVDEEELEIRSKAGEALNKATEVTHGQLQQDSERRERIKDNRNLDEEDIEKHKIGYWNDTVTKTLKQRFNPETLVASGLFKVNCPKEDCEANFKHMKKFYKHEHTDEDTELEDLLYPILANRVTFPYRRYGERTRYFIGNRSKEQTDYWYDQAEDNIQDINDNILNNPDTEAETMQKAKDAWVARKCGKYVKIAETPYNDHIIWQELEGNEELVITEGIYDAISANKAGYSVASPITTKFNSKDQDKIVEAAKNYNTVHLVFDGDTAGKEGQQDTAKRLVKEGVEPNFVELEEGKDLDDWTNENGYNIQELLESGEGYLKKKIKEAQEADSSKEKTEIKEEIWKMIWQWDKRKCEWIFEDLPGSKNRDNKPAWNEFKKQKQREMQKKQSVDVEEIKENSEEVESEDVKSQIDAHGKKIYLNPAQEVYVEQLKATAVESKSTNTGILDTEKKFKVFEVAFGKGGEDQPTFNLLTHPFRTLTLGENHLAIRKADLSKPKYKNSDYFKEEYKEIKKDNDDFTMSYEEWLNSQEEYLEIAGQLGKRSQEKVKELSNQKIVDLVEEYLISGYHTDTDLRTVMYPQIIQHDKTKVEDPGEVMKYQPHSQLWTNTKVGKSKTAQRVGRRLEDSTPAGLLGYADSDGKQEGTLDGIEKSVWIDEFNFGSSSDQMNDNLLPMMEDGRYRQDKAGRKVVTRFYGSLNYMANPRESNDNFGEDYTEKDNGSDNLSSYGNEETSFELISKFEELIRVLGFNIEGMGSRFGVVLFNQDMDTAQELEENDLTPERKKKLETLVDWMIDEIRPKYTQIEREMRDWLETEYSNEYKQEIVTTAKREIPSDPVKKYWINHIHSYRHARGLALRRAVYNNIGKVLKDEYTVEELEEEADSAFENIKELNKRSLQNMAKVDDEAIQKQAEAVIEGITQDYRRLFVKTVIEHWKDNDLDKGRNQFEAMPQLKETWHKMRSDLDEIDEGDYNWHWSKIKKQLKENKTSVNQHLNPMFGVKMYSRSGDVVISIDKPSRFERYESIDVVDLDSDSRDNDDGDNDGGGSSSRSEDDVRIEGDYQAKRSGIEDLFLENEDSYEDREIPQGDIVKYYGRKFDGRKHDKVLEILENLSSDGWLRSGPSGSDQTWIRVRDNY